MSPSRIGTRSMSVETGRTPDAVMARPSRPGVMVLLAMATALSLVACAGAGPSGESAAGTPASEENYKLGPGDKVRVSVFGDPSLTGEHQVDGAGAFTFPLIGVVKANGKTSAELRTHLETRLKEYMREPNVGLEILSYRPFYIVGEVRKPGSYNYVDGMTVMNAIAIAGGFTYRAREEEFVIQRRDGRERTEAAQATRVQPGDVIIVRERYF